MTELRIVQWFIPNVNGQDHLTRYTIQQKVQGQWTELPVTYQEETDPSILERFERTPVVRTAESAVVEVSDGQG